MKIKEGFLMREVAGTHVVVPVGAVDFDGMIKLNETGAVMWKVLECDCTLGDLTEALLSEYEVDRATAEKDAAAFVDKLSQAGLLDESL